MKTIGIIGGMSWESSALYYAAINRAVRDRLGPPNSARILMDSLNFGEIERLQHEGAWDELTEIVCDSAAALEAGGAECLLIATNTMHKIADEVEGASSLPLIHIADCAADAVCEAGITQVALLGTAFTMEEAFYTERLTDHHGLDVIIPEAEARAEIHRVIYEELVNGDIQDASRSIYREIIAQLIEDGAKGIIMGCTEIPLLIDQSDSAVPLFDTTALHAMAAVDFALS